MKALCDNRIIIRNCKIAVDNLEIALTAARQICKSTDHSSVMDEYGGHAFLHAIREHQASIKDDAYRWFRMAILTTGGVDYEEHENNVKGRDPLPKGFTISFKDGSTRDFFLRRPYLSGE